MQYMKVIVCLKNAYTALTLSANKNSVMLIDPLWSVSNLIALDIIDNQYTFGDEPNHLPTQHVRIEHFLHLVGVTLHASVGQSGAEFFQRQLFVTVIVHATEHPVRVQPLIQKCNHRHLHPLTAPSRKCLMPRGTSRSVAVSPLDCAWCHRPTCDGFCSSIPIHRAISSWSGVVTSAEDYTQSMITRKTTYSGRNSNVRVVNVTFRVTRRFGFMARNMSSAELGCLSGIWVWYTNRSTEGNFN